MRADLQALAKVMRPISDERARELVHRAEQEAGPPPAGFVAAESDGHAEYWETARRLASRRAGLPTPEAPRR